MIRLTRIARHPAVALVVAGGAGASLYGHAQKKGKTEAALCEATSVPTHGLKEVAQRLGTYVMSMDEQDKIALRAEKLGVKVWEYLLQRYVVELFHTQDHVYAIVDEAAHAAAGGLPVVRVAQALIKAPVEDVATCWWQVGKRKEWDSINTKDSQVVRSLTPEARLVYLQSKPKKAGIVSSRDFCYVMYRAPPEVIGAKPGSVLFVQANTATEVPHSNASTRGDVNSLLLLEPVDPITTKAYYAIEMNPKGWLPLQVVKAAADETPLTLAVLRNHIEKELMEEASLSPDAAAKHAVQRRENAERSGKSPIVGAWASREDLVETKKLLEKQLKKASADERKTGIDLSGLRAKIREEIAEVDGRL